MEKTMSTLREKRRKFEGISRDINLGLGSSLENLNRFTCPCCGYPTLEEHANYEICELCDWEDDGQDDEDSSEILGGPNGSYSLDQARENFVKYRIMYTPDNNTTITGGGSEEQVKLKEELVVVFESILSAKFIELPKLWQQVLKLEEELDQELSRSIEEYEKSLEA